MPPAAGNSICRSRPSCCCTAPASTIPPGPCTAAGSPTTAMACWRRTCRAMDARSARRCARSPRWPTGPPHCSTPPVPARARLVGHSMGSLIALETAARHPARVSALSLIGTAAAMTVGPDLLKAAEANDHSAVDMVSIWGLGFQAELGGSLAPGLWMHSGAQRVLEQCRPGVLFNDLSACNSYQGAPRRRRANYRPDHVHSRRTRHDDPCKSGQGACSRAAEFTHRGAIGAGHMMMAERPDELLAALQG